MIDWHSHILPGMDDGSRDPHESIAMLEALESQGVDTVIATPHFYANKESVETFLNRRRKSYSLLFEKTAKQNVRVLCGSEVKFYPGISRMEELQKLTIENTNLLLLEMPFKRWTNHTIGELIELANIRGLKIILAHIERYLPMQDRNTIERLAERGILMQVNGSFFEKLGTRQKAIRLLRMGRVQFVGSDCHNMTTRPPRISPAYRLIRKKLGEQFAQQMNAYGYHVLGCKSES